MLLDLLRSTPDWRVRNATAIALADLRVPELFDVIVELLRDPRTSGQRGSLLYSLETYDCASIVDLLVDLAIDDGWEASRQAVLLIDEIDTELDDATWTYCLDRLEAALPLATDERRPIVEELLQLFER